MIEKQEIRINMNFGRVFFNLLVWHQRVDGSKFENEMSHWVIGSADPRERPDMVRFWYAKAVKCFGEDMEIKIDDEVRALNLIEE